MWVRSDDWVGAVVEDTLVMVNIDSGKYVSLNRTADAVWQALETPRKPDQICDILQARFDVPQEECAAAVRQTLDMMRERELARPQ